MIRDSGHPPSVYSLRINRAHPVVREIRVLSIWFEGHLILATKTSPTKLYRFATLDGPGTHWPAYVGDLKGEPRISMLRASPDHSALIASEHQSMAVFEGRGPGSRLEDFVGKWPAYGRVTFRGDNVEAGDFFPLESCDVIMLAESRHVYRVLAR